MTSRVCSMAAGAAFLLATLSTAFGQSVRFDAPGLIEGRDVTTAEFQSLHPREKLVEFAWEISVDMGVEKVEDVSTLSLRLHTLESDVTIVDYGPRTVIDSDVDGPIAVEQIDESSSSLGLQAGTGGSLPWTAGATAGVGGKNAQSIKYKKKPAQQAIVSSGIWDRGMGLFIKLRKSSQQPLDGMHPVQLTLRMPSQWRTGYLRLECEAFGQKESRINEPTVVSLGKRVFLLPLLIEGDEEARVRARAIQQSENTLRSAARSKLDRAKPETLWGEITRWSQPEKKSPLSSTWIERVTTSSSHSTATVEANLPREVAIALKDYARQKQAFAELRSSRVAEKPISKADPASDRK